MLDIGCGDARHSIALATAFGCRVLAVDPSATSLVAARAALTRDPAGANVVLRPGSYDDIPTGDASIDTIWSPDVTVHVRDIDAALGECARVLRPGGRMVVYQAFATPTFCECDAAQLYRDLAVVPERMSADAFEHAVARAGFAIERVDVSGGEWHERRSNPAHSMSNGRSCGRPA